MKNSTLSTFSRTLVLLSGVLLVVVLFVPLWQIELNAPQYPEGLVLKMYPHKIGGNVDVINGLNHYIGMKTLHTEDFIEFTILPYIVGFFALFCFVVFFLKKQKWLIVLFTLFVIFGIIAMIDFWRWEYAYGHDLNPEAPIQVPGMAYQPPLIGYKQLLNFGAYSIPDVGGILFILVGLLLLVALLIPWYKKRKMKRIK
jgi:copper chaperone NosL